MVAEQVVLVVETPEVVVLAEETPETVTPERLEGTEVVAPNTTFDEAGTSGHIAAAPEGALGAGPFRLPSEVVS